MPHGSAFGGSCPNNLALPVLVDHLTEHAANTGSISLSSAEQRVAGFEWRPVTSNVPNLGAAMPRFSFSSFA
eukprot:scaffold42688_cov61-Phaeocystis_antarctica.AAC.4